MLEIRWLRYNSKSNPDAVDASIRSVLATRRKLTPLADEIGQMIVSGRLQENEALSERMFGVARGVSRTSFREAIKILEGKGLVRAKQNTGTQVAGRRNWHLLDPEVLSWRIASGGIGSFVQDFFLFRRSIEPPAAAASATRQDLAAIKELRSTFERMRDLERADPFGDGFVEADVRFHQAIFEASGNEFLRAMGHLLEVPLTLSFTLHSRLHVGPTNRISLHEAVVAAIEAGDAPAAGAASLALLQEVGRKVEDIVSSTNASAEAVQNSL